MGDTLVKVFQYACWASPVVYGASIFVRAYLYELQERGQACIIVKTPVGRKEVIV